MRFFAIALSSLFAGCQCPILAPSGTGDRWASYSDVVELMNGHTVPTDELVNVSTRPEVERQTRAAFIGKPAKEVIERLGRQGYDCKAYRPVSATLSDALTGTPSKGIYWCTKSPPLSLCFENPELMDQTEMILVEYDNGLVTQVAVY